MKRELLSRPEVVLEIRGGLLSVAIGESGIRGALISRAELDVGEDFDPYRYWDLDMIVITPNMDPMITGIEVLPSTRNGNSMIGV